MIIKYNLKNGKKLKLNMCNTTLISIKNIINNYLERNIFFMFDKWNKKFHNSGTSCSNTSLDFVTTVTVTN